MTDESGHVVNRKNVRQHAMLPWNAWLQGVGVRARQWVGQSCSRPWKGVIFRTAGPKKANQNGNPDGAIDFGREQCALAKRSLGPQSTSGCRSSECFKIGRSARRPLATVDPDLADAPSFAYAHQRSSMLRQTVSTKRSAAAFTFGAGRRTVPRKRVDHRAQMLARKAAEREQRRRRRPGTSPASTWTMPGGTNYDWLRPGERRGARVGGRRVERGGWRG